MIGCADAACKEISTILLMLLIMILILVCGGAAHRIRSKIRSRSRSEKSIVTLRASPYSSAMRNILLIILILLLIGAFPGWGYSSGWGYYPFGGIGLVLLIVLILALTGRV